MRNVDNGHVSSKNSVQVPISFNFLPLAPRDRWTSNLYPIYSQLLTILIQISARLLSSISERFPGLSFVFNRPFNASHSQIAGEEGIIAALLQIIAADSIDVYVSRVFFFSLSFIPFIYSATRQACSVWLKNRVHTHYAPDALASRRPESGSIANSDRDALRANILPLLAASPSRSITVQLAHSLKNMVMHDFPASWPGLLPALRAMLTSSDIRQVHAGCVGVLETVRAFR